MNLTLRPLSGRGCGFRDPESAYICCGAGLNGKSAEFFLIDPALEYGQGDLKLRRSRAPRLLQGKDGVQHVGIFLSKKDYPASWDFVEESRLYGVSRKVPPTFPLDKLAAGLSQMLFFHEYAIPDFNYCADADAPLDDCHVALGFSESAWEETCPGWHPYDGTGHKPCTLALKDLAYLQHIGDAQVEFDHSDVDEVGEVDVIRRYLIRGPSYSYYVKEPLLHDSMARSSGLNWLLGAFLRVPITHVEFKDRSRQDLVDKANKGGFETFVCPY